MMHYAIFFISTWTYYTTWTTRTTWTPSILKFANNKGLTTISFSTLPYLLFLINIFRNSFWFCYLDNSIPYDNRSSYAFLPLFLKCPRVRPCEYGCIHEDTLFTLSCFLVYSTFLRMENLWMDTWPYYPGWKVGKTSLSSSFLTLWWRRL
jgi:hypothetical protein